MKGLSNIQTFFIVSGLVLVTYYIVVGVVAGRAISQAEIDSDGSDVIADNVDAETVGRILRSIA